MSKPLGSTVFGTNNVRTDEYLLLAKVMTENGSSIEEAALDIEAIDDLLGLQRIQIIATGQSFTKTGRRRKNADMQSLMNGRLDLLLEDHRRLKNTLPDKE